MSITIVSYPSSGSSTATPTPVQIHTQATMLESDPSFKMGVEFVTTGAQIPATWLEYADLGSTGLYTFELQDSLEDGVSHDLQAIDASGQLTTSNSLNVVFLVFKSYHEVNGVPTLLNVGTFNTEDIYCLNASRQYLDTQTLLDYFITISVLTSTRKFLTNSPTSKRIKEGESEFLSAFSILGTASVRITKTNADTSTANLDTALTLSTTGEERWDFGVGISNINALSAGFIDDDVVSYTVEVINATNDKVSERRTYVVDRVCREDSVRVHFLNALGGFDSYTFEGISRTDLKTKSRTFERYLPKGFSNGDRGTTTIKTDGVNRVLARSYPLKQADREWLQELFTSQQVFIQDGTNYIPVVVKDNGYIVDDKTKNLQRIDILLEYANKKVTGRA